VTRITTWVAALALTAGVSGYGISLCDYRTPTTEFLQGKISFFYQHMDDPATSGIDLSAGSLTFTARRQRDGETMGFTLAGEGEMRLRNLGLAQTRIEGVGALRQYLTPAVPLFAYSAVEAMWDTANPQPGLETQAGLGYGRFYNVTPLAKALQIEAFLLERGVLSAPLVDDKILAVAKAIGQPVEVASLPERVGQVVALIEGDRPLQLDPVIVLAIEETLARTGRERFCGWTAQAGLAYRLVDPKDAPRELFFSLSLDAAIAPEPHSQLLFRSSIAGPPSLLDRHTLTLEISFDVQMNRSINFTTRYTLFQDKPAGQVPAGMQLASFVLEISHGWIGVTLQMEFSKLAEAPAWKQSIVISATTHLW